MGYSIGDTSIKLGGICGGDTFLKGTIYLNSLASYSHETIDGFDIQVLLPGYSMNEITVEYENEKITVKTNPLSGWDGQLQSWKAAGAGTFSVPGSESVKANLKNGVLYLYAPKKVKGVMVDITEEE